MHANARHLKNPANAASRGKPAIHTLVRFVNDETRNVEA
jgi:hypothetical protein